MENVQRTLSCEGKKARKLRVVKGIFGGDLGTGIRDPSNSPPCLPHGAKDLPQVPPPLKANPGVVAQSPALALRLSRHCPLDAGALAKGEGIGSHSEGSGEPQKFVGQRTKQL